MSEQHYADPVLARSIVVEDAQFLVEEESGHVFADLVANPPEQSVHCRIGPELAEKILGNAFISEHHNLKQRGVKKGLVEVYAQRMLQGRWKYPAEPLLITGKDGTGANAGMCAQGQHRLHAVIKAGKVVDFDVRFGVDPQVIAFVDEGNRTLSDYFRIRAVTQHSAMASAIKPVWRYLDGDLSDHPGSNYPDKEQSYDYLQAHPDLRASLRIKGLFKDAAEKPRVTQTVAVAVHYLLCHYGEDEAAKHTDKRRAAADDFLNRIVAGLDIKSNREVCHKLRKLLAFRSEEIHGSVDPAEQIHFLAYTWNKFLKSPSNREWYEEDCRDAEERFL